MAVHYPNGKKYVQNLGKQAPPKKMSLHKESYSNRGMTLEDDLNETNEYYLSHQIAVIHKKPTPLQIVKVDYPKRSAAVIREAYFKQASTTDYNGVYKGKYIDFEAKETQNVTSFPLKNFHDHQILHMKNVIHQQGIAFVIIRFSKLEEVYLLEAKYLLDYWKKMLDGGRKSIAKDELEKVAHPISLGFRPRIDYIKVIDSLL